METPLRFGAVEVRPATRTLLVDGKPATVGARAYDVLLALIEHRGRVLTKDELLDLVWPNVVVEENNLPAQISRLRKVLGAGAIATIPGRGYRFTMEGGESPLHLRLGEAPARSADEGRVAPRRSNLPAAWESLVGRGHDVTLLAEEFRLHRLVSIVGPGGVGKTRLAQEVARNLSAEGSFSDGIWWVDLASVSSASGMTRAIASAANLKLGEESAGSLAAAVGERQLMLVLDNCEHLAPDVAAFAHELLRQAPQVALLATSQVALKVSGEQQFRLEPLPVPPPGADLAAARQFGALELLERRARASSKRYEVTERTLPLAIELCRHLDGNALAIEMVATRLPSLGLDAVLARLGDRFAWMRGAVDAPQRQQSLAATLEWSYSLLDPREQEVLRRLSVFSGSFSLESARRVSANPEEDEWIALDALGALVDKSLVRVTGGERPRYRLLETTRLFAMARLRDDADSGSVRARYLEAMADLGIRLERRYWSDEEEHWLAQALEEYPDLQAAFELAVRERNAGCAAPIGNALGRIEYALGVGLAVRARKRAAYSLLPFADDLSRARLWNCLSTWRLLTIEEIPLVEVERQRVAAWRALGDRFELYEALGRLAAELADDGRADEARAALAEAEAIEDPAWPPRYRAMLAYFARAVHFFLHDVPRALVASERFLSLCATFRVRGEPYARSLLAEVVLVDGRYDEATALSEAACAGLRDLGAHGDLGLALRTLCAALLLKGETERARSSAAEAFAILSRNGLAERLVPHAACYAADAGQFLEAAQLLGASAARNCRYHVWSAAVVKRAESGIEKGLSPEDRAAAERVGASLPWAEVERLVESLLRPS
jgi:predicted ATPase